MPDTSMTDADARERLFDELERCRAGMLGIQCENARFRPMSHFTDRSKAVLHFLTSRKSDVAAEIGLGDQAFFCLMDEPNGFYASLAGSIRQSEDKAKVDELWSPTTAAWFSGRDDPDLVLLEFTLREAEIWTSTDSSVQFGFEIARANLSTEARPDVGSRRAIRF